MRADRALIAGIAAYRRHPWTRRLPDPPAIWAEGGSRLLDYGGQGPAVMFVPSLVNRAYVLDLTPERSLMRWLPGQGFRSLLLDWGWPGEAERDFTLTDYVAGRLERALAAAPGPVVLAGYCMGGLLALAAALRRPDRVRALALLATP
ncbi:alpha/beta fold hydrolase, partial [Roseomonas alkaliterrae]|nr:alpha/beta fold hydrolase [Neoroseomonas alkaliterrae]